MSEHFLNNESQPSQTKIVLEWLRTVVAKPNKNLGRDGPVCYEMPSSLAYGRTEIRSSYIEPSEENFCRLLAKEKANFLQRENALRLENPISIVIALEKCRTEEHAKMMDKAHTDLKIDFMKEGLMVGQFHPFNETPGLHNEKFKPFKCPGFCFSIRPMTPRDGVFVQQNLPAETVREAANAFLQRFGNVAPDEIRLKCESFLRQ